MSEWQPIETAPKKKVVLLFAVTSIDPPDWKMATGCRIPGYPWEWDGRLLKPGELQPTHWMPRPEPPK